jgi:hypothetical protein
MLEVEGTTTTTTTKQVPTVKLEMEESSKIASLLLSFSQ